MAIFGVCYSPYHRTGDAPPYGVTEAGVEADMKLIASHNFGHIRTYGVDGGNQWNVDKAIQYGLQLALGVWVFPNDQTTTNAQIDMALQQVEEALGKYKAKISQLDLVIGNEVDREDVAIYTPKMILDSMQYAKQKSPGYPFPSRVTTCFSGTVLQNENSPWRDVVDFCDTVVYLTVYPWFGDAAPDNIAPQMEWSWNNGLKQVHDRGKQVVIAEIGWPSAGGRQTSAENEAVNYAVTKKWVSGVNNPLGDFDTYWFEMFDEPWKTEEGPQGPHWGLYTSGEYPKPKFNI